VVFRGSKKFCFFGDRRCIDGEIGRNEELLWVGYSLFLYMIHKHLCLALYTVSVNKFLRSQCFAITIGMSNAR
jgi:hypothetical protein